MKRFLFRIFPMLPFLAYLRPYRRKLFTALACLILVGFLEPFSILMLKPALDVIFGLDKKPKVAEVGEKPPVYEEALTKTAGAFATGFQSLGHAFLGESPANPSHSGKKHKGKASKPAEPATSAATAAAKAGKAGEKAQVQAASADKARVPNPFKSIQKRMKAWTEAHFGSVQSWYQGLARDEPFKALVIIAVFLIVITILKGIFTYSSNYLLTYSMRRVTIELQVEIFRRVLSQDFLYFKQKTTGYLISRIGSDVQLIRQTTTNLLRDGLQQPLILFFLLVLLIFLSPAMTVFAILILPIGGLILYRFAGRMRQIAKKSRKKGDELSSMLEEALRNYPVVKTFGTEEVEIDRFTRQSEVIFKLSMKGRIIRFGTGPLMESLGALSIGGILLMGGYLVLVKGTLEASGFIVYLLALTRFYDPIKRLSRLNVRFQEAFVSAGRLKEMLSMEPKITTPPEAVEPASFEKGIRIENVTFGYLEEAVLHNVSVEIPKGKMVALVGPSGAGKTTLLGLLPRLYDPREGRVLLDGVDLRKIDLHRLRRLFGVVTQETVLFNDTVVGNITYGFSEIDRERAEACARAANAHEYITQMEKGYETVIGQSGTRLSGGQAQRLAIARALYRDPPLLLLDEATSHLDAQSEALVQEAIDRLLEGRTAVVIAHRLSTVRRADIIVVMERGRVIEHGTHEELLAQVDLYKNLYALQTAR